MSSQRIQAATAFVGLGGNFGDVRSSFRFAINVLNSSDEPAAAAMAWVSRPAPGNVMLPREVKGRPKVRGNRRFRQENAPLPRQGIGAPYT